MSLIGFEMIGFLYLWASKLMPLPIKRAVVLSLRKGKGFLRRYYRIAPGISRRRLADSPEFIKLDDGLEFLGEEEPACIEDALAPRTAAASLIDIEELPSSNGRNFLLFVESAAAKLHYEYLVRLAVVERYFIVFRAKKDYLEFLVVANPSCGESNELLSRVVYIPTIDPVLDESVYLEADAFAGKFIESMERSFSSSDQYAQFYKFLHSMKVGVSDRFVGWVRSYKFILNFIDANCIDGFYVYGNRLVDNNLIALAVLEHKKIPCGVVRYWNVKRFRSLSFVTVDNLISRDWVLADRFNTTKYHISDYCKPDDDVLLFFGNLRDPMYRGTLQPVLERFSIRTTRKILVLLPYDDGVEGGNRSYSYVLPSIERDDMPGIDEFNRCFDSALDDFYLSESLLDVRGGMLALYVALNSRKSVHRVFRDCYGLMREIDAVSSMSKISALISNPGRLWPSQFIVGYLSGVPSFDIQSGTFSRSARYKKPGSEYILAVDDFSRSVYVDYLGVKASNVEVVGAPRIDARLSAIREFTKEQSLSIISVCDYGCKVLCLATQPYDIDLMSSMVREACKFVELNSDWFLLVSMHPNENDAFANAYSMVLRASSCSSRAVVSRGNIYHNLNASDAVITYFSTAGLEAFCLNKPVLAYRPENYSAVPFDLCELGVARPFVCSNDLMDLLNASAYQGFESQGLQRLKDGRSVERICDFILAKIDSY